ncbi:MAG: hypothetical protein LIO91_05245 [Bacteroidales bacterium]|nr:hypothetical protein [Bacteroidales bacterium]
MIQAPIMSAYVWGAVILIVFFLVAVTASNMILYKPNNPGTAARKVWFWLCCLLATVATFAIGVWKAGDISVPVTKQAFENHVYIATGVVFLAFILVGFAISKICSNSKLGTWF